MSKLVNGMSNPVKEVEIVCYLDWKLKYGDVFELIYWAIIVYKKKISKILFDTIKVNSMKTDVHLRLVVSRGIKSTPYQDPAFTISKPTIVVIPEYKQPQDSLSPWAKNLSSLLYETTNRLVPETNKKFHPIPKSINPII